MVALSSLFSWPFAVPSLPSISLPANVQRRFLSYVLKRALGRFVKTGGLDVDRIQAQISEGWVEIEGLEVDTEAINGLLPSSIPLSLTSGRLDHISAKVPFPNLWSAPLGITLDELTLDFDLVGTSTAAKGKSTAGPSPSQPTPTSPTIDLAESVTSAADEFLHEELDAYEEAELDRSIRESIVLNQSDPFNVDEVPGGFPFTAGTPGDPTSPLSPTVESKTALAGLVERVLARLQVKVRNVRLLIRSNDKDHPATFELRIGEIHYADESDTAGNDAGKIIRVLRISLVSLYMLPHTPESHIDNRPRYASSTRSSSTSSTSTDHARADLAMSFAVADLRQSSMSSIASGASVYQSALEEGVVEEEEEEDEAEGALNKDESRSPTPTPQERNSEQLIVSFGGEDIVLRLATTRPSPSHTHQPSDPVSAKDRPTAIRRETEQARNNLPAINLDVSLGAVSAILFPEQVAAVLAAAQNAVRTPLQQADIMSKPSSERAQPSFEAKMQIRGIYATAIYDMDAHRQPSASLTAGMDQFWTKPSTTYLPAGHLKLRIDDIRASYVAKSFTRAPPASSRRVSSTPKPRRPSFTARYGPLPSVIEMTVNDISIFEYLASDSATSADDPNDTIPGGAYPVLIFDSNLPKQYESGLSGALAGTKHLVPPPLFPEYDTVDWRNSGLQKRGGTGEKVWRVRPKLRSAMKGTLPPMVQDDQPVVQIYAQVAGANSTPRIKAIPLHLYLDLSLLERLLPMLRYIAPAVRSSPSELDKRQQPFGTTPLSGGKKTGQYVIDDLDAQAASFSTLRAEPTARYSVELTCPLLRIDIRCPAPPSRRGSWGDGAHLRSGIVTLDLHGIRTRVGGSLSSGTNKGSHEKVSVQVDWDKTLLFFYRVPDKRAHAVLIMGPLAPDPSDPADMAPLRPSISLGSVAHTPNTGTTSTITCRIPFIQAEVQQKTIEGLQFFADDITHWLDGAFGDGSAPRPRDDLKMIGSRFFGSKGSSSVSSSTTDDLEEVSAGTIIRLQTSEVDVALYVPRKKDDQALARERLLSLKASDLDITIESNLGGKNETSLSLSVMDADFSDRTVPSSPTRILGRITPLALSMHNSPLLLLRFDSRTDPGSGGKESGIKLNLTNMAVYITKDLAWTAELASFAKTPEGVFEDMTPAELTRVRVELFECSVHISAPTRPGAMVLALGVLSARTDIMSDAEDSLVEISLNNGHILAIDDMGAGEALPQGAPSSAEAWTRAGYASMIAVDPLELQLIRDLTGSKEILLDVLRVNVRMTACADSLVMLSSLVADLAHLAPASNLRESWPLHSPTQLDQSINVFSSIDEDTFKRIPDPISGVDLIEDDLPSNLDYLDAAASKPRLNLSRARSSEGLRSWETEHEDFGRAHDLKAEINGETVKILIQEPIDLQEDYWNSLPVVENGLESDVTSGNTRIRVHDATIGILLHDGYDWQRTRKTIEEEVKAVRRRLERIRQLLASGQKADDSVERASSMLFNSIYIGLDQSKEHMDTAALLAAIDDELEELRDDTASQSSWQTLLPAGATERVPPKRTRLRGKRLTRSRKAQIEIAVSGLKADIDLYGPLDPTAARLHITAKTAEILDHIKTSTWKKFLSEMRADSRGNIRETEADMLRFELLQVRPSLPHPDEELRLRVKVLPLRLHIDQDALDFLKRFFSFQVPETNVPANQGQESGAKELFFQHVEIYPVEIKLDYKPKRVDFAALRDGRTIELMNFFHFDGAEMTLRHITLSGISGLSRLSSLLQDIWTPDVKANQLADVISGVSPIRSMVNVGSGVADLILLPIEQYRKDGRLARGVQRGTNSFVRSTAMEMMKLGAKLATGTQVILEKAEGVLGGGGRFREDVMGEVNTGSTPRHVESSDDEGELVDVVSRYANQPTDAREGIQAAYKSLSTNINSAAQTILAVPMEVYERSGDNGPLKAVVRAVPIAVLRPMIGASEAVSKTLLGVRNSLDPRSKEELGDKYK